MEYVERREVVGVLGLARIRKLVFQLTVFLKDFVSILLNSLHQNFKTYVNN